MDERDQIKERLDIVDLISEYLPLKKAGTNFKAPCPFHNEKTPSFMVSPDKQIWHCFGCGLGGDIFTFIMEKEGLEFGEAIRILGKKAGVEIKPRHPQQWGRKNKLYEMNNLAAKYFHQAFLKSREAKIARDYFAQRQFNDQTIEEFFVGYSPHSWDLTSTFLKKRGYSEEDIFSAGLSVRKDRGGYYDRFRGRLMFPIKNIHGDVVGFGGRVLRTDDRGAKYLNTPETEIYHKSGVIYGLSAARGAIRAGQQVIVVEGYTDVLASHQSGVKNVVASSGTALTEGHLELLKRFTKNIALAFDMDLAGDLATRRGIDLALQRGFNVTVIKLPAEKDPGDLAVKDPTAWRQAIKDQRPIMEYFFESSLRGRDPNRIADKKKIAGELLPVIRRIDNNVEQYYYLERLARTIEVPPETLQAAIRKLPGQGSTPSRRPPSPSDRSVAKDVVTVRENRLLGLLIRSPSEMEYILDNFDPDYLSHQANRDFYILLEKRYNTERWKTEAELLAQLKKIQPDLEARAKQLVFQVEQDFEAADPEALSAELRICWRLLKHRFLKQKLQDISGQIFRAESRRQTDEVERWSAEFSRRSAELHNLETEINQR